MDANKTATFSHRKNLVQLPIYVNRAEESFNLPQHRHDVVEITYVAEGKGFHYINQDLIDANKGDVFLIPVGTSHVFRPSSTDPKSPLIVYNCLFPNELLKQWADLSIIPSVFVQRCIAMEGKSWFRAYDWTGDYHRIFSDLYLEYSRKNVGFESIVYGKVIELLGLIYRSQTVRHEEQFPKKSVNLIEDLLIYIENHFTESGITAQTIAKHFGISISQFHRLFNQHCGKSFIEHLQELRMEHSCSLLRETSYKISHIANLSGYLDIKYFHLLFKRRMGITPHQYRLKHRRG